MGIREIVFYVHGVMPQVFGGSHRGEYETLHNGIRTEQGSGHWPNEFGGAEWGWNKDGEDVPKSHEALSQSQRKFGKRIFDALDGQWDFTLNPLRLAVNGFRSTAFYGFGDMFYYTSKDGKLAIRNVVAKQLLAFIEAQSESEDSISLTLLGHSAGSVVAFDFLYYLFTMRTPQKFLGEDSPIIKEMENLKDRVKQGQLRLRRLFTFGSPISMLAFRSDALVEILSRGEFLRPVDYGFLSQLSEGRPLSGPRWINFWDRDDPIAWPIEPIMNDPTVAIDRYVDVSDSVTKVHTNYWRSDAMQRLVAELW